LSFLKNGVSAYAVEGIFNIKFKDNFFVVRLVHEVTGGMDCSFTPQGGAYPYLGGQEKLTEPWDEGLKQTLATRRRWVHHAAMGLRSPLLLENPWSWAP